MVVDKGTEDSIREMLSFLFLTKEQRGDFPMKQSLQWHTECLENQLRTLDRVRERLEEDWREYEEAAARIEKYRRQVERAKAEGRDGFDREKFNMAKK